MFEHMHLHSELDQTFEDQLSDGAHASETSDFVLLHLEQYLIGLFDHCLQAIDCAAAFEGKCERVKDGLVDDEHLIH